MLSAAQLLFGGSMRFGVVERMLGYCCLDLISSLMPFITGYQLYKDNKATANRYISFAKVTNINVHHNKILQAYLNVFNILLDGFIHQRVVLVMLLRFNRFGGVQKNSV